MACFTEEHWLEVCLKGKTLSNVVILQELTLTEGQIAGRKVKTTSMVLDLPRRREAIYIISRLLKYRTDGSLIMHLGFLHFTENRNDQRSFASVTFHLERLFSMKQEKLTIKLTIFHRFLATGIFLQGSWLKTSVKDSSDR